jgi:hypothetical protein
LERFDATATIHGYTFKRRVEILWAQHPSHEATVAIDIVDIEATSVCHFGKFLIETTCANRFANATAAEDP